MTSVSEIPLANNVGSAIVMTEGKAVDSGLLASLSSNNQIREIAENSPAQFAEQTRRQTRRGFSAEITTTSMGATQSALPVMRDSGKGNSR
ncbi:MAG: hypothetical protein ACN2B6_04320 [Rickettsiales bacterium]